MRVLRIRFKNLNSLAGEWEIDLTHPAFAFDGIFAITGPTGAGKTTILDAVCLALYGRTPRLNRVTKNENEVMSRQTGECFAEVTFETQAGRYRCHWSQHRAHKKPAGDLQAQKHEIADADSGAILESNVKGVAGRIEAATGMDFDRFTRSMLLAQGGFAAFLQAAPDDRAPILEQITGMEIYGRISIRVHERQREEREKLNLLQSETAGIAILDPEQEMELERTLEARREEEAAVAAKSAETGKAIAWLGDVDGLRKDLGALADEMGKLRNDAEAFKPDREKLDRASRAASLDGAHATLTAVRKQQKDDGDALNAGEKALPGLESSAGELFESLQSAELRTVRTREEQKAAACVSQKVRILDQKLADWKKIVADGEEGCGKDAAKLDADKQARLKEREKLSSAHKALDHVDAYLAEHARDEWLIGGLAGIEEQLGGLVSGQNEILRKRGERDRAAVALEQAIGTLGDCRRQSGVRRRELEEASKRLREGNAALGRTLGDRLLREYRAEREALLREMAFLAKIAELEEYRVKLEDGKPCPLCGAVKHPFAEGNVPVPDETERRIGALAELIGMAEDQEAAIRRLEAAENQARKNLAEDEKREAAAVNDREAAGKAVAEMGKGLETLRAGFIERRQAVSKKLLPLGVADIPETDVSSLLGALEARRKAWLAHVGEKADIEKRIASLDGGVKRLDAVIETQSASLAEKRERLEAVKRELATGDDERNALYGDKNPETEDFRLDKAVSDAEDAERRARSRYGESREKWSAAKAHIESLKKRIGGREPELERRETEFAGARASAGFSSEESFLAAALPSERRAELAAKARELGERQADLKARQRDRETRLTAEMNRNVTDKSLEELEPQFEEYEKSLRDLREVVAGLKHRLSENTAAKERIKEKRAAIDARKEECRRWENLHELIGSADGKKYRNFAQGLTFEMMIGHANRQLRKMTDRYLLIRDDKQPLELNVVDNYQAGETRSAKNLSGGENFIVSLSLALGLSNMASRNVRVDSLFLDEGFGSLDEEALDAALETLAGLRRDGKLIGVISHVPALKERIGAQIQVTPQTGGRSRISGPGCYEKS